MKFFYLPSLIFFFLFFFNIKGIAQQGDLYLYNYKIPIKNIDNQNFAIAQGKNDMMYFANKKGVMSYDGVSWHIIPTQNTPYALSTDIYRERRVYVGCRESLGYLITNAKGIDEFVLIQHKHTDIGEINKIILLQDVGYFYSDKALLQLDLRTQKITQIWRSTPQMTFQGIALLKEKVYIQIKNKGLHLLQNNTLQLIKGTEIYSGLYLRTSTEFDKNKILLGMSNNWAYFFDGQKMQLYVPIAKDYLKGNVIHTALNISESEMAFATLSGGVIVIQKQDFSTKTILNYQTGLPDDEVYAMTKDSQGGLWICHAKGITRADVKLPIRNFSGFAGIEGNLESMMVWHDTLFVSTGDGLFYLSKVDRFEEVENLIRKEQRYLKTVQTVTKTVRINNPENPQKWRVYTHSNSGQKQPKRKIEIAEETETVETPKKTFATELTTSLFSTSEARKAYALQSIPFIFKKVNGLDTKCKQMLIFQNQLLVASNLGLYRLVKNGKELFIQSILQDEYIEFIIPASRPNRLYVGTNSGLFVLEYAQNNWKIIQKQEDISTAIFSIIEFNGNVWAGAESQVFRIPLDAKGNFGKAKSYQFKDSYSENVTVRLIKGAPAFLLTSGIYSFSTEQDAVFKDAHLQKYFNAYSPILYRQNQYTWLKKSAWQNITNPEDKNALKTVFLEFFENIQEIYVDERKNIWLIDDNRLYRINAEAQFHEEKDFNIFIRNVIQNKTNEKEEFLPLKDLKFDYQQKGLSFSFKMASPFYRNESAIEYQYWLEGLSEGWTDWDTKAIVSYPYVPVGKYKLHVRARNIFGDVSKEQVFSFEIKPPFWETYWFYGLQLVILAGLLGISFVFNRRGKNSKFSIILTLISLITLFEFLTLYFEPYVDDFANGIPIFKLGMNILLALILLPAEHWLRRWLQRPAKRITGDEEGEFVPERAISNQEE